MNRIGQAAFVVLLLALTVTVPSYAQEELPPDAARRTGMVLNVDLEQQSFSMRLRSGILIEVHTTAETQFNSRVGDLDQLDQLTSGMWVVASGQILDSIFMAKQIAAGGGADPMQSFNAAGKITNIIPGHEAFDLTTRAGESIRISITGRTRFRSRDRSIESMEDLEKGMFAVVRGVIRESGAHLAAIIVAGERDDLHPVADRAVGRIVDVDERDFTLQIQAGGLVTIVGNEHTKFRSHDGWIQGFEDFQPGMFAIVAGKDLGNGQMKARWIAAWMPEKQESSDRIPARTLIEGPEASGLMMGPGR